ncbi:hypothetical protein V3C99_009345, partial [Haemonchus contortus]
MRRWRARRTHTEVSVVLRTPHFAHQTRPRGKCSHVYVCMYVCMSQPKYPNKHLYIGFICVLNRRHFLLKDDANRRHPAILINYEHRRVLRELGGGTRRRGAFSCLRPLRRD